jgi:hypothetical protein
MEKVLGGGKARLHEARGMRTPQHGGGVAAGEGKDNASFGASCPLTGAPSLRLRQRRTQRRDLLRQPHTLLLHPPAVGSLAIGAREVEAGVGHALCYATKLKLGKRGSGPYHVAIIIIIIIVIRHNAAAAAGRALLLVVSSLIDHASAAAVWTRLRHVGLAPLSGTTTAQLGQHKPHRSGNGGRQGQWINQPFRQQLHSGKKPNPPARFRCRQTRHKTLRRDREE